MGREVISSPAEKEKAGNNHGLFCMAVVVYGVWGMDSGLHHYGKMQVKRFCQISLLVPTATSMTTTGMLYGNFSHCVAFK
jgi:hypothetical protein